MSGDPADRSKYRVGVLREDGGRGGSQLLHRIFTEGRKLFISKPINHFPLHADAAHHILMGGGIGITPMIAMAHELHAAGSSFEMHYSCSSRNTAGYLGNLQSVAWNSNVQMYFSDEGSRANLNKVLSNYQPGQHVYTCGPDRYMQSVHDAANACGFPEDSIHSEYFSVPETPEYINYPFTLKLVKSGKQFEIPTDKTATDVLIENGINIDVKCSDGLCGVCKCGLVSGVAEHRDFVLSGKQRESGIILCQSRAAENNGVLEIDL